MIQVNQVKSSQVKSINQVKSSQVDQVKSSQVKSIKSSQVNQVKSSQVDPLILFICSDWLEIECMHKFKQTTFSNLKVLQIYKMFNQIWYTCPMHSLVATTGETGINRSFHLQIITSDIKFVETCP